MLRYAAYSVPWARVGAGAVLVLVLMDLVRRWPFPTWALQAGAVGLLAGVAAWCFDEPAARLVDTAPRSLAWRTVARLPGVVLLAGAWVVSLARDWDAFLGHAPSLLLQGLASLTVALAWATWWRSRGVPMPGTLFAFGVIPATMAWSLAGYVTHRLPVFPGLADGSDTWARSTVVWLVAGGIAAVVLLAALADAPWWRISRQSRSVHSEA